MIPAVPPRLSSRARRNGLSCVHCNVWTHLAYLRVRIPEGRSSAFFCQPLLSAFTVCSPSQASTLSWVAVGSATATGLNQRVLLLCVFCLDESLAQRVCSCQTRQCIVVGYRIDALPLQ